MELALRALTDKTGVKGAEENLCNISSVYSAHLSMLIHCER